MILENRYSVQSVSCGKIIKERLDTLTSQRLCTLCLPDQFPSLLQHDTTTTSTNTTSFGDQQPVMMAANPPVLSAVGVVAEDVANNTDENSSSGGDKWNTYLPIIGMAPCDPIIAFETYVLIATTDCRICVYTLPPPSREQHYNVEETEREEPMVKPIVVTDPLDNIINSNTTNDNNNASTPSFGNDTIVAMHATPLGVCLINHDNNNVHTNDLNYNHHHDSDGSSSSTFLGHVAVLTCEGFVYVLEFRLVPQITANSTMDNDTLVSSGAATEISSSAQNNNHIYNYSNTSSLPNISVKIKFHTENIGATCLCIMERFIVPNYNDDDSDDTQCQYEIFVGHNSGIITCHDIIMMHTTTCSTASTVRHFNNNNPQKNQIPTTDKNVNDEEERDDVKSLQGEILLSDSTTSMMVRVRWRGAFEHSIGSISPLGTTTNATTSLVNLSTTSEISTDLRVPSRYLAVGLIGLISYQKYDTSQQQEQQSPSTTQWFNTNSTIGDKDHQYSIPYAEEGFIEVIDVDRIEQEWISSQDIPTVTSTTTKGLSYYDTDNNAATTGDEVDLQRFCIWPEVGMEFIESPSIWMGDKRKKIASTSQLYHPEIICAAPKFCKFVLFVFVCAVFIGLSILIFLFLVLFSVWTYFCACLQVPLEEILKMNGSWVRCLLLVFLRLYTHY